MTISISADAPEAFSAVGCSFRVLDDGGSTDGRLGLVEIDLAPGWPGPPQHVHRKHDETFYVLEGNVRFTSGTDSFVAGSGRLVTAPIGDPHTFSNADDAAGAKVLCTITPERYIGYFRELSQLAPEADGRFDPAKVLTIMARYATEPYRD